jgi:hypothetical protein
MKTREETAEILEKAEAEYKLYKKETTDKKPKTLSQFLAFKLDEIVAKNRNFWLSIHDSGTIHSREFLQVITMVSLQHQSLLKDWTNFSPCLFSTFGCNW